MATNVLVIPEDFRWDQYVLRPIIKRMFASLGVRARVEVCCNPLLGGVREAMKWARIEPLLARYRGMTQIFLLIVDRDCDENRRAGLDQLESRAAEFLADSGNVFLAENAWQEVEVWVLAGLKDLPGDWSWREVRAECHPKEVYYDALARQRGLFGAPHDGRNVLAPEAAGRFARIRKLCPEDVGRLEQRIRKALKDLP